MSEEFLSEEFSLEKIKEIFKINHPISIFTRGNDGQTNNKYQSRVVRLTIDTMEIVAPVRMGLLVFFNPDDLFFIRVQFESEVYEFKSSYIYKSSGQPPVWVIQIPYVGRKIQERAHSRIALSIPVKVFEVSKGGDELPDFDENIPLLKEVPPIEKDAVTLLTRDISIGGIKIVSARPYFLNSELQLSFEIKGYGEVRILGRILRVETHRQDSALFFFNVVRFTQVNERDFRAIKDFIFRTQFKNRISQT